MIKGCIFDLDGVIVDTAKFHYLAWKQLAAELGFEFTEAHNEALKGVSRMASLDILLSVGGMQNRFSDGEKTVMAARKNRRYVEYISLMDRSEILPGVTGFLAEIRKAGIATALGSASKNARLILSQVGLTDCFDAIVDGTMVSRAKPDPQVFLTGARMLRLDPSQCVVFEDAEAGIEAASRAGMFSVAVGESPTLSGADARIPGFEGFTLSRLNELTEQK